MKAVQLTVYNKNVLRALLSLKVVEKENPILQTNEVLVKMHAASCNPSDVAFIQGGYNIIKKLPAVPGFEGSGVVVDAGSDLKDMVGKKAGCFIQDDIDGTWAEYFKLKKNSLIILDEAMDLDQAACFSVNPFTAYAMMEIAEIRASKVIILNAAGGQVPSLVRQLAKIRQIETINVVRKVETAEKLKAEGEKYVLVEQDENFSDQLKQLAHDLNATTAFDAVGGHFSGLTINAMPPDSELIIYGGLSNKLVSEINPLDVIFQNKIISGFNLLDWKDELEEDEYEKIVSELQQLFIKGSLKTNIQGEVKIDNIIQGLKTYLGNMSSGKMLIKP